MNPLRRRLASRFLAGLLLAALAGSARAQPDWTPKATYSQSMTLVAVVSFDGVPSDDPADLLAGFVGGASHGVASPVNVGGTFVYFLSLGSDVNGQAIGFRAYDASTGADRPLCEGVNFVADAVRGSLDTPFTFFTSDTPGDTCALHWAVPPGFSRSMAANVAVFFDGLRSNTTADRVAAFVGDEVRGVGVPFDAGGNQVFLVDIGGDVNGETVQFRAYEAASGTTYAMDATVSFAEGTTVGTPSAPLALNNTAPLPVELTAFAAYADGAGVALRWTTASETNNAGFFVETAPPGDSWRTLGFVPGHGTTAGPQAYAYRADALPPGVHRFRLRQVDFDGTFTYSEVVEVALAVPGAFVLTAPYPNPFRDRATLTLSVAVPQRVRVALYDVLGRRLRVLFEGPMAAGAPRRLALDAAGLPEGLYVVRAEGERFAATRAVSRVR